MSIEIFGLYEKTLFRDEKDGATYFSLRVPNDVKERNRYGCITVASHVPKYTKGIPLYIDGVWRKSTKGLLFKATTVKEEAWNTAYTAQYLSSLPSKIPYKAAREIAEQYGTDVFDMLKPENIDRLCSEIFCISDKKIETLVMEVSRTVDERELSNTIMHYGGFYSNAVKLYEIYGREAKNELFKNPYEAGKKCGLMFNQCDIIAKHQGFEATNSQRIQAAVNTCIEKTKNSGHTYMLETALIYAVEDLLDKSAYTETIPYECIATGIALNPRLFVEEDSKNRVYLKSVRYAETNIVSQIQRLFKTSIKLNYSDELASKMEEETGIKYAPQQRDAFKCLRQTGVAVITGGPGTGKTTTLNGIISAYEKMYPDNKIKLCAPTGRAAQRMMESTGRESTTIHKLLDYRPFGNGDEVTYKDADDPIEADFIVVDESSMIDVELASIFLSAVQSGSLVVFVGDTNQLPSVGAGDVLHDIIGCNRIPVYKLTTIYRQAAKSPIVTNANLINEGRVSGFILNDEFMLQNYNSGALVCDKVVESVKKLHNPENPFETQVLVSMYRGDAGVNMLNKKLQELINPPKAGEEEFIYGSKRFRKNDKIIMLNNNYAKGYYNGDIGTIKEVNSTGITVDLLDREIELTRDIMNDVTLAYAITIHKSQGSEFKNVIIALEYQPIMLKRNLLYTAVTRAKKTVLIISENGAVGEAAMHGETGKRKTKLKERLIEALDERSTNVSTTETFSQKRWIS